MSEIAMPQVRGALLAAFSLSFGLGQLFNAVGFQILAEVRRPLQSICFALIADWYEDQPRALPERYLLAVRHARSLPHRYPRHSRVSR